MPCFQFIFHPLHIKPAGYYVIPFGASTHTVQFFTANLTQIAIENNKWMDFKIIEILLLEVICECRFNKKQSSNIARKLTVSTCYTWALISFVHCQTLPTRYFENIQSSDFIQNVASSLRTSKMQNILVCDQNTG